MYNKISKQLANIQQFKLLGNIQQFIIMCHNMTF